MDDDEIFAPWITVQKILTLREVSRRRLTAKEHRTIYIGQLAEEQLADLVLTELYR